MIVAVTLIRLLCLAAVLIFAFAVGDWLSDPTLDGGVLLILGGAAIAALLRYLLGSGGIAHLELFEQEQPATEPAAVVEAPRRAASRERARAQAAQARSLLSGEEAEAADAVARRFGIGEPLPDPVLAPPPAPARSQLSPRARSAAVRAAVAGQAHTVDVNTATVEQLVTLKGIGPKAAERIVADRTANGPFASLDDLVRVEGFGRARVAQLAAQGVVAG